MHLHGDRAEPTLLAHSPQSQVYRDGGVLLLCFTSHMCTVCTPGVKSLSPTTPQTH